jgi:hypothetical protein
MFFDLFRAKKGYCLTPVKLGMAKGWWPFAQNSPLTHTPLLVSGSK